MLHETLTKQAWAGKSRDAAGTLTLVYDHHRPQLRDHLVKLQHDHHDLIVSTLHAHLTHDLCLEVIVLRGPSVQLQRIASQLRGLKGIFQGELVMANASNSRAKFLEEASKSSSFGCSMPSTSRAISLARLRRATRVSITRRVSLGDGPAFFRILGDGQDNLEKAFAQGVDDVCG